MKILLLILGCIFLAAGSVLFYKAYIDSRLFVQAQKWPIARGVVTDTKIDKSLSWRQYSGYYRYEVVVSYDYQVDGKNYTAKQNRFLDRYYDMNILNGTYTYAKAEADKLQAAYPRGLVTAVYYNPQEPGVGFIDNKVPTGFSLIVNQTMALIFFGCGAGALLLRVVAFQKMT